ncbi:hypothetical protein Tco_1330646 [Tanacetum coccineum]
MAHGRGPWHWGAPTLATINPGTLGIWTHRAVSPEFPADTTGTGHGPPPNILESGITVRHYPNNCPPLKLPILKTGDYDLWSNILTHTDYALWEVIVNGDAPVVVLAGAEGPIPPKTAKQKLARKNELKAKSTLLLAIPDEHLLKFHGIKDAKTL